MSARPPIASLAGRRVGLDYLPAVTHFPGVGRYARELVRGLVGLPELPQLQLFEFGGEPRTVGEPYLGLAGRSHSPRRLRLRLPRRALSAMHRGLGLGADRLLGGVDLFHRMHPGWPPVSRAPVLQPVGELPPQGSEAERRVGRALREADHLLVMSEHGGREVVRRFGIAPERVHRVPIGCDQWRRELPEPPPREGPPRILVLGALRRERRPRTVLAAFEALRELGVDARLSFLGKAPAEREELRAELAASPAREWIEWREDAHERELPGEVARSSLLLHLSQGELSAVTPLEAFSFGTPVVASELPAFAEALGERAWLVDDQEAESDPAGLARVLARAIESASDPDACRAREAIAARYGWGAHAAATLEVWGRILGGRSGEPGPSAQRV